MVGMTESPASKKPWYWVLGAGALGLLAFIANATGVFSFITGVGSLPEVVNPPTVISEEPDADTGLPTEPEAAQPANVNSIVLPSTVFSYDSYGHETRQSHSLYSDELTGTYAYGYWGGKYGNDSSQFDGKAPFAAARTAAEPFAAWNIWEQAIWNTSDSYGMALGERFGSGGKKSPLIGVGSGAAAMQITMKSGCAIS